MVEKKKRRYFRKKIGMVFRVPLHEESSFAYGQVATDVDNVFFDHTDKDGTWTPVEEILSKPVIFSLTVDHYVLKQGLWEVLGIWPVNPEHQVEPEELFGYDNLKEKYFFWRDNGKKEYCTLDDVRGYETLTSWGHGGVEQRLRDHFAVRPNYDITYDYSKHLGLFMGRKEFYAQYGYDFHWLDDEEPSL